MKKILIYGILLTCIISGCKKVKRISYASVLKLEKQTISGGRKDTTWIKEQMKIYTDHNYIYAGIAADSSVHIGIGSYALESDTRIAEHNIFNSRALDSTQIFVVSINQTDKGITAVVPDWGHAKDASYKLTEEYTKLPLVAPSVLNGVWVLDRMYRIKGKDTSVQHETNFKVFQGGHYMFIHRYSANEVGSQYKDGFAYGTFSFKNNTLTEKVKTGVPVDLADREFVSKVILNNKEYTQEFTDVKTNEQIREVYKRLREY